MTLPSNQPQPSKIWNVTHFLRMIALEALVVVIFYLLLPVDPKNSLILGLSASRLFLIGVFFCISVLLFFLAGQTNRQIGMQEWIHIFIQKSSLYASLLWSCAIIGLTSLVAAAYPLELIEEQYRAFWQRLIPSLVWIAAVALELLVFLIVLRYGFSLINKIDRRILKTWAWISIGLWILWGVIALTGIGQTPDPVSWRELGSPILAWQFWLAVLVGWVIAYLISKFPIQKAGVARGVDGFLMICLYGLALWLWLGQPLQNSYFSPETRPPNYEVYPYSDALYYNLAAESVTLGEGLSMHSVTPRPMYLTILSYLVHLTDGYYPNVIVLQTLWLGLIPVLLYLLGKQILHRGAGISLALLAIFREQVAIQATADIQLSNSKLIMADLPTLLVMLLFCVLVIDWLKVKSPGLNKALWVGGCLGCLMLFRTQAVVLLPAILFIAYFRYRPQWKTWATHSITLVLGLVLVISPWLIRNYQISGQWIFDDPATQTSLLQSRYQLEGVESDEDGSIWTSLVQHPAGVIGFVANHFFRNEIGTIFVTPPQRLIGNWPLLFNQTDFWTSQNISLTLTNQLLLAGILALLALGIVSTVFRVGWIGLIPLAINVTYTLGNGLARNSGGRYNLPVDWIGYFYLVMGVAQLAAWVLAGLGLAGKQGKQPDELTVQSGASFTKNLVVNCLGLVLLGAIIPITESLFPQRYQLITNATAPKVLADWGVTDPELLAAAGQDGRVIRLGRELFPRFYRPGVGEQGSNWAAYAPLDECRMGFELIDTEQIGAVLVMLDRPPAYFPNRADALVIGLETTVEVKGKSVPVLMADWVVLHTNPVTVVKRLDAPAEHCRLKP